MLHVSHMEHSHGVLFILLAGAICLAGSIVSVRLWDQVQNSNGRLGAAWIFLGAVTTGATIWSTHFLSMLDFHPGVDYQLDPMTTILSIITAVCGMIASLWLSKLRWWIVASMCAGIGVGMTIAAMHFVGIMAYDFDGQVIWDKWTVVSSVFFGSVFGVIAIAAIDFIGGR